jgi:hypothetical protein
MKTFCFVVSLVAACIAAVVFVGTIEAANGAPQQAAGAAMALCIAVIPYVFSRSIEKLIEPDARPVVIVKRAAEAPSASSQLAPEPKIRFQGAIGRQDGESLEQYARRIQTQSRARQQSI